MPPSPDSLPRHAQTLQHSDPLIATHRPHLLSHDLQDLLFQARPQPETAAMACQWGGHIMDQCMALRALARRRATSAWHFMHLQLYDVSAQGSLLASYRTSDAHPHSSGPTSLHTSLRLDSRRFNNNNNNNLMPAA
jgi:hypothetical protein